jgi:desulfoferrodoxin (superoxide reductase-like protein)
MSILDFFKEKPYWHNEATKNKNEQRREFPGLSKEKHLPMLILNTKGENNLDLEVLVGEINNFISKVVKQKTNKVEYTDIQD